MRTVTNPGRGCGHLVEGGIYLTSPPPTSGGVLPAFVELDPYVPYLEPQFRGWTVINGTQWDLTYKPSYKPLPFEYAKGLVRNLMPLVELASPIKWTVSDLMEGPQAQVYRHLATLLLHGRAGVPDQARINFGAKRENDLAWSQDVLMWVGEENYPTPQDYIEEVWQLGASKRIPPATMPLISPGQTRLWLIHPKACPVGAMDDEGKVISTGEMGPGVIGYVYLDRTLYIKPRHRKVPERIENLERLDLLEIVRAEEPSPAPPKKDRAQRKLEDAPPTPEETLEALEDEMDLDGEPDLPDYDPGPQVDDEGGMSEYRHPEVQDPEPPEPDQGEGPGEGVE